jgi:hypothetical protein
MLAVNQSKSMAFAAYLGAASYFAAAAYIMKNSGIDKKIFDFSAPKVSHAAFQGAAFCLSLQTSDSASRLCTKTETKWVPSSGMYDRGSIEEAMKQLQNIQDYTEPQRSAPSF